MLTADQINAIHRLHWAEHWSARKIARHLHIGRRTLAKVPGDAGATYGATAAGQQAGSA